VTAHGAPDFDLAFADDAVGSRSLGLLHQGQLRGGDAGAHAQSRATQEGTAVHRRNGLRQSALQTVHERRVRGLHASRFLGQQHGASR
jgi:hypothetical protein